MIVNKREFLEVQRGGIPKMIYGSSEYRAWWKQQIHRCKYGYSVGGVWMPGKLYYYANFHHIQLNNDKDPRRKTVALPDITDLEWEIFTMFDEAKNEPNPHRGATPYYRSGTILQGEGKVWRPVDEGTKGIIIVGSRDSGKSFDASGIIAHEYTFYKNNECIVSASSSQFSKKLLDKVRLGLDELQGATPYWSAGKQKMKPSPITHRRVKKDFYKEVRSGYYKNGLEKLFGYNSAIYNIIYDNDDMAANGFRPSVHIFEEAGAWDGGASLIASYNSSIPCWEAGAVWAGVPIVQGTGGNMQKGTTDLRKMFYNPEAYNCLAFEDKYEHKGKIGYYIPATKAARQFKDENGNTDLVRAEAHYLAVREKNKRAGDKDVILKHIMYRPLKPSECFLKSSSGIFPTRELQEHLAYLENNAEEEALERRGFLSLGSGELKWGEDNDLIAADFPVKEGQKEGCVAIWELPIDNAPEGLYIAGTDPYDQDNSTTNSLGSTFIFKRHGIGCGSYYLPVAEYTGRPEKSEDYYEQVRLLMKFYGAKNMYENQLKGFMTYFKMKNELHMLAEQPELIKDIVSKSTVDRGYGVHMITQLKKTI